MAGADRWCELATTVEWQRGSDTVGWARRVLDAAVDRALGALDPGPPTGLGERERDVLRTRCVANVLDAAPRRGRPGRSADLAAWVRAVEQSRDVDAAALTDDPRWDGLHVDLDGSLVDDLFARHVKGQTLHPHAGPSRDAVVDRLRGALGLLADHDAVRELILACTRVLAFRSASTAGPLAGAAASISSGSFLSVSLFVDAPRASVAELAGAIVHESIHDVLYAAMLGAPLRTEDMRTAEASIASPWSGAPLTARSYLHACFVWYGLLNLWRPGGPLGGHPDAAAQFDRAAVGFAASPSLAGVLRDRGWSPDVPAMAALEAISERAAQTLARV